jgi:hypothetical protein
MAGDSGRQLIALLGRLPQEQVKQLIDYAEFLLERHGLPEELLEPEDIPRPKEETVVQSIKRLRRSYPMLDPSMLFEETSVLMAQHTLQGREAVEIIDELELLFRRRYQVLVEPDKDVGGE